MTYASETWTLTAKMERKLAATQHNMERSMLNITYKDRKTNRWIREQTKFSSTMDIIKAAPLQRKDRSTVSADTALANKTIVALYFSAHWCPPCKRFTPILKEAYDEMIDNEDSIEIIFVSSDRSADDLFKYMNDLHGDWLTISHGNEAVHLDYFAQKLKIVPTLNLFINIQLELSRKYGISGIPALVVIKNDGESTLVTANGRNDIETKGPRAFQIWSQ
ncbi:Nucleoredoxin-like protein 2 [Nymphon striatum]|nr:Nucleoredoxin-like protein 2 [Nymphon striatum]